MSRVSANRIFRGKAWQESPPGGHLLGRERQVGPTTGQPAGRLAGRSVSSPPADSTRGRCVPASHHIKRERRIMATNKMNADLARKDLDTAVSNPVPQMKPT